MEATSSDIMVCHGCLSATVIIMTELHNLHLKASDENLETTSDPYAHSLVHLQVYPRKGIYIACSEITLASI